MPISRNRPKSKGPSQPKPQFNDLKPKFRVKPYLFGFKPGTVLEGPSGRMWIVSPRGVWFRIPAETAEAMRTARENHARPDVTATPDMPPSAS